MSHGNDFAGPAPVGSHSPEGDSPFGVADLVGNIWQYTDEFQDDHTRAVILRGGSNYYPTGSHWYFPQALELNTHNKYFLMDARYERAGTVGFRCVADAS
jgi:formylglycine-generating enzyme required for sulfatase activity